MVDAQLLDELAGAVGATAVFVDQVHLAECSHDAWPIAVKWRHQDKHPFPADVVVRATTAEEVAAVLAIASRYGVPVTPRSMGSSVTGASLPTNGGVVLDVSGLVGPEDLNEMDLTVRVPAGVCGADLEHRLNARGYTLGNSPQSLARSSVGGWLATRESGQFSSLYGGIEDLVTGLEVVLSSGKAMSLSASPRAAIGPDMRSLFIGSEGTLGVITAVTLKVFPMPERRVLEAFSFPDVATGIEAMRMITRAGIRPLLVRFYDNHESRKALQDSVFEGCVLYLGHEGPRLIAEAQQSTARDIAVTAGGRSLGAGPVEHWMQNRYDFSAIESILDRPGGYAETIEVAHLWSGITGLYDALRVVLSPLADEVLGHFSHVYSQGTSLYVIVSGQATDDEEAVDRLNRIWNAAMETTITYGGEISHHHGAGLARAEYLERSRPDSVAVLRAVKMALDPSKILNPGKLAL
jgi:alkyldihydroxyacetonephosphate synthase